jgi:LysM repeat protein
MRTIVLLAFLFAISTLQAQNRLTAQEYIQKYSQIAITEMKRYGIPASITLAQGMLESDNGNSTLARKANNHFGIKCHKDWNGSTYYHDDDHPNECFRKYNNAEQSYVDHSEFLSTHQRYAFLFEYGSSDYKKWAHGLKKAGYATNKQYAEILIRIIEENELHRFDDGSYNKEMPVAKRPKGKPDDFDNMEVDPFGNDIKQENRINYIVVRSGDTFNSIAERYGMRAWQLYKYNELPENVQLTAGQRIYLQPKRRKADVKFKFHTVQEGENMWAVSQLYGIKLKRLYQLNRMQPGTEPEPGQQLSLRRKVRQHPVKNVSDTNKN